MGQRLSFDNAHVEAKQAGAGLDESVPTAKGLVTPSEPSVDLALGWPEDHKHVVQVLTPELMEDAIAAEFISETEESLTLAENMLLGLEVDYSRVDELIHPLFCAIHTLKGNSAAFELTVIKRLALQMEDVLDLLRKGLPPSPELLEVLFAGLDTLGMLTAQLRMLIEGVPPQPVAVAKVFALLQGGRSKHSAHFVTTQR